MSSTTNPVNSDHEIKVIDTQSSTQFLPTYTTNYTATITATIAANKTVTTTIMSNCTFTTASAPNQQTIVSAAANYISLKELKITTPAGAALNTQAPEESQRPDTSTEGPHSQQLSSNKPIRQDNDDAKWIITHLQLNSEIDFGLSHSDLVELYESGATGSNDSSLENNDAKHHPVISQSWNRCASAPTQPAPLTSATAPINAAVNTAPSDNIALQQQSNMRIRPICITSKSSFMAITDSISNAIGHNNFSTKSTQRGIEVTCKDASSRLKLLEHLRNNNIEHYTHGNSHQTRIYIQLLHWSTPTDWIRQELYKLGYRTVYVAVDKDRRTGKPLNAFNVVLDYSENVHSVFNVNKLGNQRIKVQKSTSQYEPPQCHRCQQFGHTKNNCHQPFVCVKCAGNHQWQNCPKPANQDAKCANCDENHPANYRGCRAYKAVLNAQRRHQTH